MDRSAYTCRVIDLQVPASTFSIAFDDDGPDGWSGGQPPGVTPAQWPRSRVNGLAMTHLFTLRVPESYRVQGPEFVAVALFQSGDDACGSVPGVRATVDGAEPPAD